MRVIVPGYKLAGALHEALKLERPVMKIEISADCAGAATCTLEFRMTAEDTKEVCRVMEQYRLVKDEPE